MRILRAPLTLTCHTSRGGPPSQQLPPLHFGFEPGYSSKGDCFLLPRTISPSSSGGGTKEPPNQGPHRQLKGGSSQWGPKTLPGVPGGGARSARQLSC